MKKLNISWTAKKIVQNINKGNILFNHPIQRKSEQWSLEQKSLLIHSILAGYPIPPFFAVKDEEDDTKYSVLDGKQRLTTIDAYVKDGFKLSDVPKVKIDNDSYELSGLTFSELPQELKDELHDVNLVMYIFEDCTEEEIEEIFYRLNNGTALTRDQKTRAKLGNDLAIFIDEILDLDFFKKKACFTKSQLRRAEDQTCILQTLMLITDYKFSNFGGDVVADFVEHFRISHTEDQLNLCKELFAKLNDAFDKKHKLIKKINIPMYAMTLKESQEIDITFEDFKLWINNFVDIYDTSSEYASYCNKNTTNKDKVNKRLNLMLDSLMEYVS